MEAQVKRHEVRRRIRHRIRKKLSGSAARPRLAIFRSIKHIYAQAIDDERGCTIAFASTQEKEVGGGYGGNAQAAKKVGETIAQRLKEAGVERVVFDRGGCLYHGRVRALAEAAREAGLKF